MKTQSWRFVDGVWARLVALGFIEVWINNRAGPGWNWCVWKRDERGIGHSVLRRGNVSSLAEAVAESCQASRDLGLM